MTKHTFKVDDRVRCKGEYFGKANMDGEEGTVIAATEAVISVEFDNHIDGHDSSATGSFGKFGHCWNFWLPPGLDHLEKIEPAPVAPVGLKPQFKVINRTIEVTFEQLAQALGLEGEAIEYIDVGLDNTVEVELKPAD